MDRSDDLALRDGFTAANYASITRVLLNQFRFFCVGQLFEPDLLTGAVPILFFLQHKPHALQQFSRIFRDCGRADRPGDLIPARCSRLGMFFAGRMMKSASLVLARTPAKFRIDCRKSMPGTLLWLTSATFIHTAQGRLPAERPLHVVRIRTDDQVAVDGGGHQNALARCSRALEDHALTKLPLDLSSR